MLVYDNYATLMMTLLYWILVPVNRNSLFPNFGVFRTA